MRFVNVILLLLTILGLSSCKTAQHNVGNEKLLKIDSLSNEVKKMIQYKNKKLVISGENDAISYEMADNQGTDVFRFTLEKDMDKAAFDGGYREEVVFELPQQKPDQEYADAGLQNAKMLFGRYCFCRGQAGLFRVVQGKLAVRPSKNQLHFDLVFKVSEVPQLTTRLAYRRFMLKLMAGSIVFNFVYLFLR